MENKNGGQAFPAMGNPHTDKYIEGMTLRDYFAAKAMYAILGNPHVNNSTGPMCEAGNDYISRWAYEQADAMLKESGK